MTCYTIDRTIARSSKKFEHALEHAENVRVYTLDNGFTGKELTDDNPNKLMPVRDWLRRELSTFSFAKLRLMADGTYQLKVHGNCWYTFEAKP